MSTQIQFKRGTAADLTAVNPVLAVGEPGYELDTGKFKIGDGTTAWSSLLYQQLSGPTGPQGATGPQGDSLYQAGTGTGSAQPVGGDNAATDDYAVVSGGLNNIASGLYAVVSGGVYNVADNDYAVVSGGAGNTVSGYGATIGGGALNAANYTYATVAGGAGNIAGISGEETGGYGAFIGAGTNNTASGYWAPTIAGGHGNTASASYSAVGGGKLNTASGYAATVSGGKDSNASGDYSVVAGLANTASGNYSTVSGGRYNTASGYFATVGGGKSNIASGDYAAGATIGGGNQNTCSHYWTTISGGAGAVADRFGMRAYAAGYFSAPGDAQSVNFVLRNTTYDATPTPLLPAPVYPLTIPSGKVLAGTATIVGVINGGSKMARYVRQFSIKNVGGTTSLAGSVITVGTDQEDDAAYDVAITAVAGTNQVQITVTGKSGETIRWMAHVEGVEIAYG